MENRRNKSPALDKPGKSPDSMSNFQDRRNCTSSLSAPSLKTKPSSIFYDTERRGPFSELVVSIELSRKNSSEIILELIEKLDDFAKYLESNLKSAWIVTTITILSKVCSTFFRQIKLSILKVTANAKFLQTLERFIRNLKYEDRNNHFSEEFLVNLVFVCESIIEILPTEIEDSLQKLLAVVDDIVTYLSQKNRIEVSQKTKANIKTLIRKIGLGNGVGKRTKSAINDFRRLSVCFKSEDILTSSTDIVEGKYVSVDHYREMQSRLMMENFVAKLKAEIVKCTEYNKNGNAPIRIYPDVTFGSMVSNYPEAGVILKFSDKEIVDKIFSPPSKCLNWGSTLCFTKDNFVSVFIGWVIAKDCKKQRLIIGFENDNSWVLNSLYTMAEFNISFQICYNGLKGLECMTDADFPMKRYLIDAVPTAERPNYLDQNSSVYTIQGIKVDVFGNNWPTADQLELDATQYTAFKAALTQKFVMIQGGPRTGKIYLGLKIVKTLLQNENQKIWYNETPILIVCLSNQVLDTFLEDLIPTTSRIIRVGKTKSEKLVNFTLNSARNRNYPDRRRRLLNIREKKMKELILMLNQCNKCLNQIMDFNNTILHLKIFESIDDNLKTGWFSRASAADHIAWLFDKPNKDLHSIEISEIIKQITEEKKHIANLNNNTILDKIILLEPFRLVFEICKKMQEIDMHPDEMEKLEYETQLKDLWRKYQYFKMIHREFSPAPTKPINVNYDSPHSMDPNDRWNLYFYWLNLYKNYVEKEFLQLRCEYREQCEISNEMRNILDLEIIKPTLILGMTMNTATMMRKTLQTLKCRIVVVQETSNVSESHTVLALTKHCEHLILMGNQFMINSTSVDNFFNAGPSIMERMLHVKVQPITLAFQHRMRPEISQLLELENHNSVTNFLKILGIPFCIFFVNHEHNLDIEEYNSKINFFEAKFLINLARYLIRVGYAPEDITILAAFSGQKHVLCDEKEKYQDLLKNIEIRAVDTYQGKECKIILLSLVRNNDEGKIGCLQSESFVNLALSRAREALYMIGNIELLCQNNQVWSKIKKVLVELKCIENYLPVCCKNNVNHISKINQPEDFDHVPEEVCSKTCGHLLNCGHSCWKQCHNMDGDHAAFSCTELCKI